MAEEDKIAGKAEELKGRARRVAGEVTGDESMKARGKGEQARGSLRQAVEKVKDIFRK